MTKRAELMIHKIQYLGKGISKAEYVQRGPCRNLTSLGRAGLTSITLVLQRLLHTVQYPTKKTSQDSSRKYYLTLRRYINVEGSHVGNVKRSNNCTIVNI